MTPLSAILLTALSCPAPKVINTSGHAWNDFDQKTLVRAQQRCVHHFPNSPCLLSLLKYAKLDYRAQCGAKR
jgi:hypothetical protein